MVGESRNASYLKCYYDEYNAPFRYSSDKYYPESDEKSCV